MADTNPKVMAMVEREVKKNADVETSTLYEKAQKVDKGIAKLTLRQFNARYPLQVKRRMKPKKKRSTRKRTATSRRKKTRATNGRAAIRAALLDFAKDIARAEGKAAVVDVIAGVDKYVDRVEKAAG